MENITNRQSNYELLRIIAMMMVVGLHYFNAGMGGAIGNVSIGTTNYYLTYLFESIFMVGVNVFVLISGYFMIKKDTINIRKCVDLLILLAFYGICFYIIRIFIGIDKFSIKNLIKVSLPILTGSRWFVKTYIILVILSPFLNKSLRNLNENQYKALIIILLVLFSIWPSFIPYPPVSDGGYGIINFVVLYSIGGYIKLYHNKKSKNIYYILIFIIMALTTFLFSIKYNQTSWKYDFISVMIGGIMLFMIFKNIELNSKVINFFARYAFGVYIIHGDYQVTEFIYKGILKCNLFYNSNFYIIHIFISILCIYIVCSIIDYFREVIFKYTINLMLNKIKIFNKKIIA